MIKRAWWIPTVVLAFSAAAFAQSDSPTAPAATHKQLVTDIQTMLSELGYKPGPADGIFGARTRQAISRYQANAGLEIDGAPSEALRQQLLVSTGRADRTRTKAAFQEEAADAEPQWQGETTASAMLRPAPSEGSGTIRGLPVGTRVEVMDSRGAWLEVRLKSDATRGWLKYDEVRRAGAAAATQPQPEEKGGFFSSLARGVTRLIRGSSGTGDQGSVTIGVRGLTREELKGATRDSAEVEKMERYGASQEKAEAFAARGRLEARSVSYLPAGREGRSEAGGGQPTTGGGRD